MAATRKFESITVATTAIGFTTSLISSGQYDVNPVKRVFATIDTSGGQIRFRYDGTDPASGEGHVGNPGDWIEIEGIDDITNFRAIRTGATSGILKVTYEY